MNLIKLKYPPFHTQSVSLSTSIRVSCLSKFINMYKCIGLVITQSSPIRRVKLSVGKLDTNGPFEIVSFLVDIFEELFDDIFLLTCSNRYLMQQSL